jgi:hypothetical protein
VRSRGSAHGTLARMQREHGMRPSHRSFCNLHRVHATRARCGFLRLPSSRTNEALLLGLSIVAHATDHCREIRSDVGSATRDGMMVLLHAAGARSVELAVASSVSGSARLSPAFSSAFRFPPQPQLRIVAKFVAKFDRIGNSSFNGAITCENEAQNLTG